MLPPRSGTVSRLNAAWLKVVENPWIDRTIALAAVLPFAWLTYVRLRSGFDLPRLMLALQGLIFIGTMIVRKSPARISTNPWIWLLTFVETYWIVLVFAFLTRGSPLVPNWVSATLATIGAAVIVWARLWLGRSIGLVPALRTLVTHGPYRFVRHPIYAGGSLVMIAAVLRAYSPLNLAMIALGIFWFVLKTLAEESFLISDADYAKYVQEVRWRWIPGVV
jgi:protein-S-isoprenylcysteine O-methyltransferase Ste14